MMFSFRCPYCSTPLRLRDLSFRGRTISCPECQSPVMIREQNGELLGERDPGASTTGPVSFGPVNSIWPRAIAVCVALLGCSALAGYVFLVPENSGKSPPTAPPEVDVARDPVRPQPAPAAVPQPDSLPIAAELVAENPILDVILSNLTVPQPVGQPQGFPLPQEVVPVDPPIEVLLADDGPGFDIQERLAQPILSFQLPRPLSLREVAFELQELLGAPVDLSGLTQAQREQPVSLSQTDTTVEALLRQLAAAAGLDVEITPRKVQLR